MNLAPKDIVLIRGLWLLERIAGPLDAGSLRARIGEVLLFSRIVKALEMLDGKRPHGNGKVVLCIDGLG